MIPELSYLVWSVVLLLVHLAAQATFSDLDKGLGWALGSRDETRALKGIVAQRLDRAFHNFLQTYPAFIALAAVIAITGTSTTTTALGAAIWFWSRAVYLPAYASGIPFVRSVSWVASIIGLLMMLWPLLFPKKQMMLWPFAHGRSHFTSKKVADVNWIHTDQPAGREVERTMEADQLGPQLTLRHETRMVSTKSKTANPWIDE